jgi:hypothetical protein
MISPVVAPPNLLIAKNVASATLRRRRERLRGSLLACKNRVPANGQERRNASSSDSTEETDATINFGTSKLLRDFTVSVE